MRQSYVWRGGENMKKNKTTTLKLMARHPALTDREEDVHHKITI